MTEAERRVYESSLIPLAIYDYRDGRVITELVSEGYCGMVGADRAKLTALLNDSMFERVHPEDAGRLASIGERFARRESGYDVLYRSRSYDREGYRYIHSVGRWQVMADGAEAAVLVYTDLSDSIDQIENLRFDYEKLQKDQFYTDAVTGIPSLNYVKQFADEKISQLRTAQIEPALIYFDIRSMITYNIEYGYTQGDALLRLTAEAVMAEFPEAMVGRGSNDHFIVIDRYDGDIGERAERINEAVKKRAFGKTAGVQCAIVKLGNRMKANEAIDRARNTIKAIGDDLNIVYRYCSQREDEDYWMNQYILQHFDDALRNGWIKVFYQPILRAKTEKVTVLEALSRWVDPAQGLIPPNRFIPVLSRYHLLHKLDLYMVEQICREFPERRAVGLPMVPVSVNFSAQDFDYVDVVEALNSAVERHGVDRDCVIVEITEQDLAQATGHFREQLRRIVDNGYRLWIDDFGTGYSSLNVFSQYHVDRIKFDMELIRHLDDNDGANRVIMKSIVEMCRQIGVHTLAEGVETEDQYAYLRDIDCEMVQGFLFYKPEPLEMSVFKIRQTGPVVPTETARERQEMCSRWLAKGRV